MISPKEAATREHLEAIWRAGVEACRPKRILAGHLPEPPGRRTIVLALGKAAVPMSEAALEMWAGPISGIAVAPHGSSSPPAPIELVTASHPIPDAGSVAAAQRLMALAAEATADDLVLVLLSGGASSLACLPGEGLEVEEKRALTTALLRSGAAIGEINCVRRHLSRIKGGRLALAAAPARVVTLAISDVAGDAPHEIGSGPTAGDPTTFEEAKAVLERYGIEAPRCGWSESQTAVAGEWALLASGSTAISAGAGEARRLGYQVHLLEGVGEARDVGREHAELATKLPRGTALISGGELTVTVRGSGRGGPNQEYALGAAIALRGVAGIEGLAADTDGIDGASEAAGAFFDGSIAEPGAEAALRDNDSGTFLDAQDALFVTGPTGTNVNDLRIILTGLGDEG
jgi:hydroxypyruvate reductase